MQEAQVVYRSSEEKTEKESSFYVETHKLPHRYLAYRDISFFLKKFVKGKKALDYGCGTGASTSFLYELGFDVIGIDRSINMLKKAQENFNYIKFSNLENFNCSTNLDLVFSSFVLFEMGDINSIITYLKNAYSFLKPGGIFIGITGSEELYSTSRKWMLFDANFFENRNLQSGAMAKLLLKNPKIEFYDYYWKEKDYLSCFSKSDFEIMEIYHPLASSKEPYLWEDELEYSPFVVFIAKKSADQIF